MCMVQDIKVGRVKLCITEVGVLLFIYFCLRMCSVIDPGEWREPFYPPPGAMAEPQGGQWWP